MSSTENPEKNIIDAEIVEDVQDTLPGFNDKDIDQSNVKIDNIVNVTDISSNTLVKIYEERLMANTGLSLKAQRLLRVAISLVKSSDSDGKVYSFKVDDYMQVYNMTNYPSKQLKDASDELTRSFEIPYEDDPTGFTKTGFITYFDVHNGVVTFGIAPRLLPFYKMAQEKERYRIGNTMKFNCSYSFAVYEYFLAKLAKEGTDEQENSAVFYMTIPEIREWLHLENTYINKKTGKFLYGGFKAKILEPVKEDLNRKNAEGKSLCNINFDYKETYIGRSVVGIEFNIYRVKLDTAVEKTVINPFYEALTIDMKLAYDALLGMDITTKAVETVFLTVNKDEKRIHDIVEYAISKQHKGKAYVAACVTNMWTSDKSFDYSAIKNITKAYNITKEEIQYMNELEAFISCQSDENKDSIFNIVKKALKDKPQVERYILSKTIEEILQTNDIKILFLEQLQDIILNNKNESIAKAFKKFRSQTVNEDDIAGRDSVIQLFKKYGIREFQWKKLLEYTDEHIMANIKYADEKYGKNKKAYEYSGIVIKAILEDYASFEQSQIDKKEMERKAAEFKKLQEDALKASLPTDVPSNNISKSKTDEEDTVIYEEFMQNSTDEDKEHFKIEVLENTVGMKAKVIANKLNVTVKELKDLPLETLLSAAIFRESYKNHVIQALKN